MNRLTQCAACLLLAAFAAGAETNQERGKRIVGEAVAALGGDKFLAMRDRVESGRAYSFYREELSGLSLAKVYTRYLTRPEQGSLGVRERQSFGKKEDNSVLFNETEAFELTFRGARPLPADQYERFRESMLRNVFYILRMRLGEPGMLIESQGADVVDNRAVEVITFTDNDNRVVRVDFQVSDKLPVRQRTERRNPLTKDRIEEITRFAKFRDVGGGVKWPFTIYRERDGEKIFEIYSDTVTINQDLKDDLFTLPSTIKILGGPKKK